MNLTHKQALIAAAAIALLAAGCAKKKIAAAAPPPPSPAPAVVSTPAPRPASQPERAAATQPPPAAAPSGFPSAATRARIDQLLAKIEDAYFDYDKDSLRPDALRTLQGDSAELRDILKDYPTYKLTIEGYCDERGSAEYNLALGDRRAQAAKDYLVQVGIPSAQFNVVSYGKERQVCQDPNEACWQRNRRIHIAPATKTD